MEYISVKEASELWAIDTSNIGKLCRKGKIEGAKIVGRNWLIPKNAQKPIDGRTKTAKENQNATVFRFPLYINFPEESFIPSLSNEESSLKQAQVDFYACEFEKAKISFEELPFSFYLEFQPRLLKDFPHSTQYQTHYLPYFTNLSYEVN